MLSSDFLSIFKKEETFSIHYDDFNKQREQIMDKFVLAYITHRYILFGNVQKNGSAYVVLSFCREA